MKKTFVSINVLLLVIICLCVTGCGMRSTQKRTASRDAQSQSTTPSADPAKEETSSETLSKTKMDMGFYSTNPNEIKKKLKSYPNKYLSKEDALQQNILLHSYENFVQMREIWEDFVTHFRECQKEHIDYQQSLLIVSYTVEGDAIYTYVYNHNGSLFVYEDGSRDQYGAGSPYYFQTDRITLKKYSEDKTSYAEYKIGSGEDCRYLIWEL